MIKDPDVGTIVLITDETPEKDDPANYARAWLSFVEQEIARSNPVHAFAVRTLNGLLAERPKTALSLVDIACGDAGLGRLLAQSGAPLTRYVGIDRNADLLGRSAMHLGTAEFHDVDLMDATASPSLADRIFDADVYVAIRILNNIDDEASLRLLEAVGRRKGAAFLLVNPLFDRAPGAAHLAGSPLEALAAVRELEYFEGSHTVHWERTAAQYERAVRLLGFSDIRTCDVVTIPGNPPSYGAVYGFV
jgi:SAM-dependent methyltransferase